MTAWIYERTHWIIDPKNREKTHARIWAIVLGFIPLIMAAVLIIR